jgi:hypothetical protein
VVLAPAGLKNAVAVSTFYGFVLDLETLKIPRDLQARTSQTMR